MISNLYFFTRIEIHLHHGDTTHSDLLPRYIHDSYNMALTTLGGKARNGGSESEMYKRAKHSAALVLHTCGLREIAFES